MLMRMLILIPILFAAVTLTLAAPAPTAARVEEPTWGKPVNGLRLGLRRAKAAKLEKVRVIAVLENVSGGDRSRGPLCRATGCRLPLRSCLRAGAVRGRGQVRSGEVGMTVPAKPEYRSG
jgi:hypothetical protein